MPDVRTHASNVQSAFLKAGLQIVSGNHRTGWEVHQDSTLHAGDNDRILLPLKASVTMNKGMDKGLTQTQRCILLSSMTRSERGNGLP